MIDFDYRHLCSPRGYHLFGDSRLRQRIRTLNGLVWVHVKVTTPGMWNNCKVRSIAFSKCGSSKHVQHSYKRKPSINERGKWKWRGRKRWGRRPITSMRKTITWKMKESFADQLCLEWTSDCPYIHHPTLPEPICIKADFLVPFYTPWVAFKSNFWV